MKISSYPNVDYVESPTTSRLIVDEQYGTRTALLSQFPFMLFNSIPLMHNNIFRGKNLGTTFTSAHAQAISNGSFNDLFIGDYWTVGSNKFRIVDFNYYPSPLISVPHIIVMPDKAIATAAMHSSTSPTNIADVSTTDLWKVLNTTYTTPANTLFGTSHVHAKKTAYNANGVTGSANEALFYVNKSYADANYTATLPNEIQIFGTNIRRNRLAAGRGNDEQDAKRFQLFNLGYPVGTNQAYWLRDQVLGTYFASCNTNGSTSIGASSLMSSALGVRPYWVII